MHDPVTNDSKTLQFRIFRRLGTALTNTEKVIEIVTVSTHHVRSYIFLYISYKLDEWQRMRFSGEFFNYKEIDGDPKSREIYAN